MPGTQDQNERWWAAVDAGDVAAVRTLLEAGADPNWRDTSFGRMSFTALHFAAGANNCELIKLLLGAGADVNARAEGGWTPLLCACNGGYLDAARVLLDAGADTGVRNDAGYTALGRTPRRCTELVALLQARGAPAR